MQAMQYSNGLSNPAGLWLGHWLFDAIPGILITIVVVIVVSTVQEKDQFHFTAYFVSIYDVVGGLAIADLAS